MGDDKNRFEQNNAENGPVAERTCTDIICFIFFIIANIMLLVVASMGWSNGDPTALTSVFDGSDKCCGNICGKYPEMEKYKYLYVSVPSADHGLYHTTCVEECPDKTLAEKSVGGEKDLLKCNLEGNTNVTTCDHNCDAELMFYDYTTYIQIQKNLDPNFNETTYMPTQTCVYQTKVFLDRICFPSASFFDSLQDKSDEYRKEIEKIVDTEALTEYVESMKKGWPIILASVFVAIIIGFFYMYFIKMCAGVIVWLSILTYHLLLLLLAVFSMERSNYYKDLEPPQMDNSDNMKYVAITLYALLGISVIVVCCFYHKIQLAVAIIKSAADYVNDVRSAMVIPPIFALITALYWFVWIIGFIYLYSWGDVEKRENSVIGTIKWPEGNESYVWFFLFQGLWGNAFIQAACQFILVSCPCMWYFAQPNSADNLHTPVLTSIWRLCRYHFGSIAFGSLIVAIVQLIRVILAYIDQQAKQAGVADKQPFKCFLAYLQCMAACFERFIKFINKNAYIEVAMNGTNFCRSAREAMRIIWNNATRASIINGIGGIFIFIGQFLISMLCVMVCYQILTNVDPYKDYSPFLPCLFIFIISYTISKLFLSVYGSGIDAIFLCFCTDEELARGKGMQQPQHCPAELQDFFEQKVKPKEEKIQKAKTLKEDQAKPQ